MPAIRRGGRVAWGVPRDVLWGVYRHDCLSLAAQMAYYGLFSLFPFLLFLRALVPHVPGSEQLAPAILDGLAALVGTNSRLYEIVRDNVVEQIQTRHPTLLSAAVVLTLWSASSGFSVLLKAVNRAYGVQDSRSWYRRRVLAVLLTLAAALLIPTGVALVLLGPRFGRTIIEITGAAGFVDLAWRVSRWPLTLLLLVAGMALIYLVAPDRKLRWRSVAPGSLFAVAAVVLSSLGLSWFLSSGVFRVRWLTYGAIGTVIVILFWMYLMAFAVLVGAEINSALGRETGREPGERVG